MAHDYLQDAVLDPLGMGATAVKGSPAKDLHGSVRDLIAFVGELFSPIGRPFVDARRGDRTGVR